MSTEEGSTPKEPLDVYTMVSTMIEQMAYVAWGKMGLQPDLITGKLEADLPQAKVAIDVVTQLVTVLEPKLDDEDRRQVQSLVRDLRVNYVEKMKEAGA